LSLLFKDRPNPTATRGNIMFLCRCSDESHKPTFNDIVEYRSEKNLSGRVYWCQSCGMMLTLRQMDSYIASIDAREEGPMEKQRWGRRVASN